MLKLKKFKKGGVHPSDNKSLSSSKSLERIPAPELLYVPVNQHIGTPCTVKVKEGDKVFKNQIIAQSENGLISVVHSPVSGEIVKIEKMEFPGGKKGEVIVIKNDKEYKKVDGTEEEREITKDYNEFIEIIKNAGIIGMGGAGFPTYVKLSPPEDKKCDVLIINGAECEPYLNADYRAMLEYPEKLLNGVSYLLDIMGINEGYIGIEANKPDAIKKLNEMNNDSRIKIEALRTMYPQGAEKQLIYALTKRTVPLRKLPFEVGVIVQNVGTILAIYDAVKYNKPLTERILTVSGKGVNETKNIIAAIGTKVSDIIEFCNGIKEDVEFMISGGPMMGKAFDNIDTPISKTTSGLLFITHSESTLKDTTPCIRCGRCVDVCPMGLNPTYLAKRSKKRKYEEMDDVLDCIECGSCSFICPASRPLAESIIKGKEKYIKYLKRSKKNG